ncbi:MAG: glycoside hydrolase family 26 protein [Trueperaceae bacterium]
MTELAIARTRSTAPRAHGTLGRCMARAARTLALAGALLTLSACGAQEAPDIDPLGTSPEPLASYVHFGAFTYGGVWQGMEPVARLEAQLGRRLDVVHWFMNWDHAYDAHLVDAVLASGSAPLISWQPHGQSVDDIAAGAYDGYLRSWADGLAAAAGIVYLRPFPEMNGDWVPWNGDPDGLVAAWTRMTALFDEAGASNVRWVWGPNVTDEPRTDANRMERYYPGAGHVDVLALSGYNWGATRPGIGWRSFEEIFEDAYARLVDLGTQPVWIAEMASSDEGGDKAAWIRDLFASTAFPRLEALVWFDENKEADWRLTSAPDVVAAVQNSLGVAPTAAGVR